MEADLEITCPDCNGRGYIVVIPGEPGCSDIGHKCDKCYGTGAIFTADGQRLFDFLKHAMARIRDGK
jgi:DnaJ-class molecular chaperone